MKKLKYLIKELVFIQYELIIKMTNIIVEEIVSVITKE